MIAMCVFLIGAFVSTGAFAAEELTLVAATEVPQLGTFYSLTLLQPPLPFNPFPELPVYSAGDGVYVYDDRSVDYVSLAAFSTESSGGVATSSSEPPPSPGGGGGGGGGGVVSNTPPYSVAGLKLTIPVLTNGYIYTTIFEHDPALAYDIYGKTNLNSTNLAFASWGVVGQTNYYLLQSSYPGNVFLMTANGVDSDGDGLPDNWEVAYGLNPNNAADANQDPDGDGLTNWQEFQQGTSPTSAPAFQVLVTSPRNILP